ncbi:MAG: helix-turn-helix domain-containing protein [Anaeroplasma sp.]
MNQYVTGNVIKSIRENKGFTQSELAEKLHVSPKTISKWETGKGFPDVALLEDLSKVLCVSLSELFSGEMVKNSNTHSNILNSNIYVCPICGNVIFSVGENLVCCHGIELYPLEAEDVDLNYQIVEDEIYFNIDSPMTKDDYVSFIAGVSSDRFEIKKLYFEGPAEARLKMEGLKYVYYYKNRDGLFRYKYKRIR